MSNGDNTNASTRTFQNIWILGRRRTFFVPGPYQLRTILKIGGLAFLLLFIVDIAFFMLLRAQSAQALEVAPELAPLIYGQDSLEMALIVLSSIVALFGIVALATLETHKSAGPVYNVCKTMDRLAEEGSSVRLRLRKDDQFPELQDSFNRMAEALHARAKGRGEELARIAQGLRDAASSPDAGHRARLLATDIERLREDIERR